MNVIFIRHSKADYKECMRRGFIGLGLDFAELTEEGIKIAKEASNNPIFADADIIVSSPFPRALHTAAILSRTLNLDLVTDIDFREHTLDITQQARTLGELKEIAKEFESHNGIPPEGKKVTWESKADLQNRVNLALKKYLNYNKIIVVTHGMLMYELTGAFAVPYCGIVEYEFNK